MSHKELNAKEDVREIVKRKYGEAVLQLLNKQSRACCGSSTEQGSVCCGTTHSDDGCCVNSQNVITANLYSEEQTELLPEAAVLASMGCGNPTALAQLREGETVLDLGSGGGIDVLLSARRVGPTGFAYGLDMTDGMLELAEKNRTEANVDNVRFLKGNIEQIPLPDASVDVIISNCVINLSSDKDKVIQEAYRVLKPGGRLAISDVMIDGPLPESLRKDMELYVGCIAGSMQRSDYLQKLVDAGFENVSIEPTRHYEFSQLEGTFGQGALNEMTESEKQSIDRKVFSGFIRADKPK